LYYSPKDVPRIRGMIEGDSPGALNSFWHMVRYAHDFSDDERCRNIILRTLGEIPDNFTTADRISRPEGDREVATHVKTVIRLIQDCEGEDMTMKQLVDLWKSKKAPQW
jgi:hypothetical protein